MRAVLYSPLNPSDFGFIAGVYGKKPYDKFPKSLGFEGSGFIEKAPEHLKNLEGKKVSFCCNYNDEKYLLLNFFNILKLNLFIYFHYHIKNELKSNF